MERYLPQILDALHQLTASPEFAGVTPATADGFKGELLAKVNAIVDGREATAVYFPTFVTQ